jgi:hypothetical protein
MVHVTVSPGRNPRSGLKMIVSPSSEIRTVPVCGPDREAVTAIVVAGSNDVVRREPPGRTMMLVCDRCWAVPGAGEM